MLSSKTIPFLVFISCCLPPPCAALGTFALSPPAGKNYVTCEGVYPGHLQGITTNGADAIYWSFTTALVKTTPAGKVLKKINVINHHGDLTFANGKVYVAVNDYVSEKPGQFNHPNPNNPARQWVYEYDADLNFLARHSVPQVIHGAGGVAHHKGHFWVVGGLPGPWAGGFDPEKYNKNHLYEYDVAFRFVKAHELATGNTDMGIQTVEFGGGRWWFGTYEGSPRRPVGGKGTPGWRHQVFSTGETLAAFARFGFHAGKPEGIYPNASLGIAALPGGQFLIGGGSGKKNERRGHAWMAEATDDGRLRVLDRVSEMMDGGSMHSKK
ncbi:hypothetical protein [Ereboglobus sp. PH5-10]|uniref:hypothetical protein n=1 Tax=Ereboglobus sp. PH5-10 TaxID=2940629 RepID=UPI002406199F|nr:hypothetical protein [Ereboglobus sp. PH5-10]